jgi:CubicO group peptidase (beta-lactamase class C family)
VAELTVLTTVDEIAVPISHFEATARGLALEVSSAGISYRATLRSDGVLGGTCSRGGTRFGLTFVHGDLYSEAPYAATHLGRIDIAALHRLRTLARAPAMGVAWQRADGPAQVVVDGQRSLSAPEPVTPTDLWHTGSVTKSMTSTLAARLVERGLIRWDSAVAELLDDLAGPIPGPYRDVTLLHLLSHRGGLPRDLPDATMRSAAAFSSSDYVREALSQPPVGRPGQQMLYSNVDYVVAGLMLQAAASASWQALMRSHVFEPLDIADAAFVGSGADEGLHQPVGHSPWRTGPRPDVGDVPVCMEAAGRVRLSLPSLLRFLQAHRDTPESFLSQASWRVLHTPPFGGDYALGWNVSPEGVLSHGGTNQRWKCEVRIHPARQSVACSAANILNRNTQLALLDLLDAAEI